MGWEDINEQKLYTDEELKKFEEEYAKNQGWGEHAYDPMTPPPPNVHHQQQPNQVPPVGQVHQVGVLMEFI